MFNLREVDLGSLMGGDSLTTACTLRRDAIETTKIQALCDTGASGYVFIDTRLASDLCRRYRWKLQQLPYPIYPKGYNGAKGSPITQYLTFILEIDSRRIYDLPMLVIGLGSHDLIIGRNFFHDLRICIDVFHRRLRWPKEFPPTNSYSRTLATYTREGIRPVPIDRQAQQDIFRRDRLIERDDKRRRDGVHLKVLTHELVKELPGQAQSEVVADTVSSVTPDLSEVVAMAGGSAKSRAAPPLVPKPTTNPPPPPAIELQEAPLEKITVPRTKGTTWKRKNQQDLADMERELNRPDNDRPTSQITRKKARRTAQETKTPSTLDIGLITANGFTLTMRQKEVEVFSITLDGLDRLVEDRRQELGATPNAQTEESLRERIPKAYHYLLDFWSKRESDILPPHHEGDHKIELTDENTLGFSHLNKHSLEELVAMRDYLASNLAKGFIVSSKAPFASPVLFARKGDGSLRFCVDYRKLNALTKKNRYPLPLIDETLARLSRAKIFTKLDIRQAFHRIRMDPASEELTAFRTRYGLFQYKVMPFGLTNGPATFQSLINDALRDLLDVTCTAYLDDILIYSEDELQHETHVKEVIERLHKAGLQADIKKCEFGVKRTKYLGFIISTDWNPGRPGQG